MRTDTNWHALNAALAMKIATNTQRITNQLNQIDSKLHDLNNNATNNQVTLSAILATSIGSSNMLRSNYLVLTQMQVLNAYWFVRGSNSLATIDENVRDVLNTVSNLSAQAKAQGTGILTSIPVPVAGTVTTEGRPASFDLDIMGHIVNLDPLQSASLGPYRIALRNIIKWALVFGTFMAIFHCGMEYLRSGANQTGQLSGMQANMAGFSAGLTTVPIYGAMFLSLAAIVPTFVVNYLLSSDKFSGYTIAGLFAGPLSHLEGLGGVIYILDGFLPLDTFLVCLCNYFAFRLLLAGVNMGVVMAIRGLVK